MFQHLLQEVVGEGASRGVFHDQQPGVVGALHAVVQVDDVGVLELRQHMHLLLHLLHLRDGMEACRAEGFDGDHLTYPGTGRSHACAAISLSHCEMASCLVLLL